MIKLASIFFLNPRPVLQPNAEERYIMKRIERMIVRRIYAALIAVPIIIAIGITALIMFA